MEICSEEPVTPLQSQLCKGESWERVYYPPDLPPLHHQPFTGGSICKDGGFCNSVKERLHVRYCDLRDRYKARHTLCTSSNCCSCSSIYYKYFFRSKAVVLLLLINALFSTALYGIPIKLLRYVFGQDYILLPVVVSYGAAQVLFPIIGHLSDVHVIRHRVIRFSILSAWVGLGVLGIALALDGYDSRLATINQYVVFPIIFVLTGVSFISFMVNVVPFGLDQLQGASHMHCSSFFYWWYWTLSVGVAVIHTPEFCSNELELGFLIEVEVALVCLTIALVLDVLLKHWFVIEPDCSKQGNPILQICRVLGYALRPPRNQRIPSTVQHELDLSSWNRLELAKKRFGGKFETEEVENTRTFLYMIIILVSVGFILIPHLGVLNTIDLVEKHMETNISSFAVVWEVCDFKISALSMSKPVLLLVLVPALDLLVVPMLRHAILHPTILKRLGVGALCMLLSVISLLVLEGISDQYLSVGDSCIFDRRAASKELKSKMSPYWLFLPVTIGTVAEIFIYIPGYEFISAQAPYNMRGLLIGMFVSLQAFFSLVLISIQYIFLWKPVSTYTFQAFTGYACGFWYYLVLMCLAVVGVGCFCVVSCKYKRRKRDDIFNQVGMIEDYYTSGRIHSSKWT